MDKNIADTATARETTEWTLPDEVIETQAIYIER